MNDMVAAIVGHQWFPRRSAEYYRWYPMGLQPETKPWYPLDLAPRGVSGLYIHVPFCDKICSFCPYNRAVDDRGRIAEYVEAVGAEIEMYAAVLERSRIDFIYFGGGTPSTLTADQVSGVLRKVSECAELARTCEVTLEAHPSHVTRPDFGAYADAGVGRVSVGIQSLSDSTLSRIGATHNRRQSLDALATLPGLFTNYGIDLLYRCPGTTLESVEAELAELDGLGVPRHVSAYTLSLESEAGQPDRREETEMAVAIQRFFVDKRLTHYASCSTGGYDYAPAGYECKYEVQHWAGPQSSYLGLGPGAFGQSERCLWVNLHDEGRYRGQVGRGCLPVLAAAEVSEAEAMRRFFVLGLKTLSVNVEAFREHFACDVPREIAAIGDELEERGILDRCEDEWALTAVGRHFVDQACSAFWSVAQRGERHPETWELKEMERAMNGDRG